MDNWQLRNELIQHYRQLMYKPNRGHRMKTWKEVPHLFANGKFKIKENVSGDNVISDLTGVAIVTDGIRLLTELGWSAWVKDCTLIARKVGDMTDEELKPLVVMWGNTPSKVYVDDIKHHLIRWANDNELEANQFLYLLSIGVYPFDQSHFGKDVIDINTLEETE